DGKGDRQDADGGKTRLTEKASDGEPHIPRDGIDERQYALVVPALGDRLCVAQSEARRPSSRGWTQTTPDVVLGEQREMRLELGRESVPPGPCDHGQQPMQEAANALHDASPSRAKNLAMISPVRSQWRRSFASSARPAAVSR